MDYIGHMLSKMRIDNVIIQHHYSLSGTSKISNMIVKGVFEDTEVEINTHKDGHIEIILRRHFSE